MLKSVGLILSSKESRQPSAVGIPFALADRGFKPKRHYFPRGLEALLSSVAAGYP